MDKGTVKLSGEIIAAVTLAALVLILFNSSKPFQDNVDIGLNTTQAATPHDYFNQLVARPEHLASWTLRDQNQLNTLAADPVATYFTYNPGADTYINKQDAAKLYVPAGKPSASIPTTQQLRMPIPPVYSGNLLFTWDWYWGPEFLTNRGGMNHYKMFHVIIGGHALWTLMHSPAWASGGDVAKIWDSLQTPGAVPNGLVRREPYTPSGLGAPDQQNGSGEQIGAFANRWMRYWIEIKLFQPHTAFTEWNQVTGTTLQPNPSDSQGRWHMVSLWYADEQRGVQRALYRIPTSWLSTWNPIFTRFDFEMNTSQSTGFIGPWIGYGRNVAILKNYNLPSSNPESDSFIFQRPGASVVVTPPPPPPPPPTSTLLPGDLNGDKIVNSIDWSYMNSKWLTNDPVADINKDGIVNTIDFSIMNSNWLKTSP